MKFHFGEGVTVRCQGTGMGQESTVPERESIVTSSPSSIGSTSMSRSRCDAETACAASPRSAAPMGGSGYSHVSAQSKSLLMVYYPPYN